MTHLRSPIMWRLTILFLFLSMIPIGIVLVFMQIQVRENTIKTELGVTSDHARIYSTQIEIEPGKEQELAVDMKKTTNGEIFSLIANDGIYMAHSDPEKVGHPAVEDFRINTLQKILTSESTSILDEDNGILIGTYRTSPASPVAVSVANIKQKTADLDALTRNLIIQLSIALFISLVGSGAAILSILTPLTGLTTYAMEIGKGNLSFSFDDKNLRGELAALSSSLKNLAASTQISITSLENRVIERTRELERRSNLLKAVADVGKAITSFRDLSELLQQTTYLIHENFGYYHIGIFLLDEHKEYAVLSATNSEGGRRMLEKQHQLKIGETGIVGYVTQHAKARIALDVGKDAVYFDNPDLPQTRSEMALPLVISGQILGALDVQSTEPQAFSEEDSATLQILAEQLAVAIQNANLFTETEKALDASRTAYSEVSREAWSKILRNQQRIGFIATPPTTTQTYSETLEPSLAKAFETGDIIIGKDNLTISIPVKVRGKAIGAIRLKKAEISEAWTQEETNLAIALSDQLSGALESARLYRESQQRGARESLVSDISARISAISNTEAIVRETVQELGQTLGNASVSFQLLDQFDGQKQAKSKTGEAKQRNAKKARE